MLIIPWLHLGYTKKIRQSTGKLWKNSKKMFETSVFFLIKMELYGSGRYINALESILVLSIGQNDSQRMYLS